MFILFPSVTGKSSFMFSIIGLMHVAGTQKLTSVCMTEITLVSKPVKSDIRTHFVTNKYRYLFESITKGVIMSYSKLKDKKSYSQM
jgi:hypothetical protein